MTRPIYITFQRQFPDCPYLAASFPVSAIKALGHGNGECFARLFRRGGQFIAETWVAGVHIEICRVATLDQVFDVIHEEIIDAVMSTLDSVPIWEV